MKTLNKKAFSIIEYTVLLVIIIGAFLVMRNYIQRGIFGMWGQSGQSVAYGRQYDPQKTIDCAFDDQSNLWYDHNCLESKKQSCLQGDAGCEERLIIGGSCPGSNCNQLNNSTI